MIPIVQAFGGVPTLALEMSVFCSKRILHAMIQILWNYSEALHKILRIMGFNFIYD